MRQDIFFSVIKGFSYIFLFESVSGSRIQNRGQDKIERVPCRYVVPVLDGNSEIGANVWSDLGYLNVRRLFGSKRVKKMILYIKKNSFPVH